ncbi:UpxZ family transcription anti-terminator antagonist [Bacteroides fragilis]|uniref:UpxZ family transcription anti-terminator antagonist n=1 Tax=Bacteroides fragilis TaxID=817 RepID=UPI0022E1F83C|nr:UpxZ family transcription anti-terminator antagonist [Bacteroides fragilis]
MLSLQSEIDSLCAVSHELLHLGLDGEPIYSDRFRQLNTDVYHRCEHLFGSHALLTGYNATIYNHGDKEDKIQSVLNRSWDILDTLPVSLLKCRLLVACYAEVFDEELAAEAHAIIDGWKDRELTREEFEMVEHLKSLEENPYPNTDIE